jgi:hypothetical protein
MVVDHDPHVAVHLEKAGEGPGPHITFSGTEIDATGEIFKPSSANPEVIHVKDIEDPESEDSKSDPLKKKKPEGTEEEEADAGDETVAPNMRQFLVKAILACSAVLLVAYLLTSCAVALFICTIVTIAWHIWAFWAQKNEETVQRWEDNTLAFLKVDTKWKYGLAVGGLLCLTMIIMVAATVCDGRNMMSLLGLFAFIAPLTWLFSWKPAKVNLLGASASESFSAVGQTKAPLLVRVS